MENPVKMGDLGVPPLFLETPIWNREKSILLDFWELRYSRPAGTFESMFFFFRRVGFVSFLEGHLLQTVSILGIEVSMFRKKNQVRVVMLNRRSEVVKWVTYIWKTHINF